MAPFLLNCDSKCPPEEITIDLKLFSVNALDISTTPLSTPPVFNAGNIWAMVYLFLLILLTLNRMDF